MAEIKEVYGNLFMSDCDVLVNTVNCVGVMGAGIALEYRYRYPKMFTVYEEFCKDGLLSPGKLFVHKSDSEKHHVLCFPTKLHWRDPSKLDYIKLGLANFADTYTKRGIKSIAFPHLGCSYGGLDWDSQVKPLMYKYLESLPDISIEIYAFDPNAEDDIYDKLYLELKGKTPSEISNVTGLRVQQVNKVVEAIESGTVTNMLALQKSPGVGPKSTAKIYEYLNSILYGSGVSGGQLDLPF